MSDAITRLIEATNKSLETNGLLKTATILIVIIVLAITLVLAWKLPDIILAIKV